MADKIPRRGGPCVSPYAPYLVAPNMKATILTIGDEILIGQITDTNATYLAAALTEEGVEVVEHLSVGDSRAAILGGLERALRQSDLVLMTGGLGPTRDDITKRVLAEYFGSELAFHPETYDRLTRLYQKFGREPGPSHREQCVLPVAATILTNQLGTAPGMWFEHRALAGAGRAPQIVVSLPGVPYEMRRLVDEEVIPKLRGARRSKDRLRALTILTAGAGESTIAEQLEPLEDSLPAHLSLAYLPNLGTVRLRLTTRGTDERLMRGELDIYRKRIEAILGSLVYGYGREDLALAVARRLGERSQTLATAESCTGGRVSGMITAHPGASAHFRGGVVAYDNALKTDLLGVPAATLERHGAVSEATVRAMAEGARTRLGADWAIATSGVAGPGGGTPDKPVGTIWIAVAGPDGTVAELLRAGKDRQRNITYTSFRVLNLLRLVLDGKTAPTAV